MTATDGVVEDDNNTTGIAISGTISSTVMVTTTLEAGVVTATITATRHQNCILVHTCSSLYYDVMRYNNTMSGLSYQHNINMDSNKNNEHEQQQQSQDVTYDAS